MSLNYDNNKVGHLETCFLCFIYVILPDAGGKATLVVPVLRAGGRTNTLGTPISLVGRASSLRSLAFLYF